MDVRHAAAAIALGLAGILASCTDRSEPAGPHDRVASGKALYANLCAGCHGGLGEGATGPSLRDWSKGEPTLVSIIDQRMPLGDPAKCDGDCPPDIAAYILATFRGAVQCDVPHPLARGLRLLTKREYVATIADLVGVSGSVAPPPCGLTTFSYTPKGPNPSKIHVAGSFNGWPQTVALGGFAMAPSGNAWSVTKQLSPGQYTYKFVLDESQWIADPSNPKGVPDGFGGQNSVLDVTCAPQASVDVGSNLPPETRPEGFLFDDHGPARVVGSERSDEYLRTALLVAKALDPKKLYACDGVADPSGCAHAFVTTFGTRAMRRPPTAAEAGRWEKLVTTGATFDQGVRDTVAAMLLAPSFLYRSELGEKQPDGSFALDPWETASLLSYSLWGTMPDEALFDAAKSGTLRDPKVVESEARRLLASPRSHEPIAVFAEQWLGSEIVGGVDKNAAQYPTFDASVRSAMREETKRFVTRVFFETRKVDDLYTANWTVANGTLATWYGLPQAGSDYAVVTTNPERSGVLAQGAVLATTGLSDQTSPIRRGLFVRKRLLCQDFPQPPPNAGGVPKVDPDATTRQRFAQHTANEFCKSCHQYIDDLGFGFEGFDTVGHFRTEEGGKPIDANGDMNDVESLGKGTHAPFSSLPALGKVLAASDSAKTCVVRQYFRFVRGDREPDSCALAPAKARLAASGGDPIEMIVGLVTSPEFLVRK